MNCFSVGIAIEILSTSNKLFTKEKENQLMKKMLQTVAIVLMGYAVKANHLNSEFNLDVFGNTLFTVTLDNQCYDNPDFRYHILNIEPGTHYLQVMTNGNHSYGYTWTLFRGYINIPVASRVAARIDRFGRYKVLNVVPLFAVPVVYNVPVYQQPAPYYEPMSDYDFDILRNSIESKSFESTRMEIAKQVLSQRFITARQVTELMNMMTFESTKLELAKYAYQRTIDKENYFRVNDAFTFESSIRELDEYIRQG